MRFLHIIIFFVFIGLIACSKESKPHSGAYSLIEIPSPSLSDAVISPKKTQKVGVYLPPSYSTSDKRYPVVYYLTGFTVHPGEFSPFQWIDSIMINGYVEQMIFVEISGFNFYQGTMYANSPVTGNWEDFVTQDVIHFTDNNYRTIPERESRGIAGHSMGGGGCFNISLKHADKYAVAYPMSPAISANESMMKLMFPNDSTMMLLEGLENEVVKSNENDLFTSLQDKIDTTQSNQLWLLGIGSAFAPDLSKPLGFALPFDRLEDGSYLKNDEIWNKWEYGLGGIGAKIKKYKDNLLQYRHYSIDCGYNDDIEFIKEGTSYVIDLFEKEKIPFSAHWYDGDHVNKVEEQLSHRMMPIMSTYLVCE